MTDPQELAKMKRQNEIKDIIEGHSLYHHVMFHDDYPDFTCGIKDEFPIEERGVIIKMIMIGSAMGKQSATQWCDEHIEFS